MVFINDIICFDNQFKCLFSQHFSEENEENGKQLINEIKVENNRQINDCLVENNANIFDVFDGFGQQIEVKTNPFPLSSHTNENSIGFEVFEVNKSNTELQLDIKPKKREIESYFHLLSDSESCESELPQKQYESHSHYDYNKGNNTYGLKNVDKCTKNKRPRKGCKTAVKPLICSLIK